MTQTLANSDAALRNMSNASTQVKTYTTALAAQTDALIEISEHQAQVSGQLREATGNVRASFEQHDQLLKQYERIFENYRTMTDGLDTDLAKIFDQIHRGMREYAQGVENNFREIVKISNQSVPEISKLLQTQIQELSGQLESELGSRSRWRGAMDELSSTEHLNSSLTDLMTSLMVTAILIIVPNRLMNFEPKKSTVRPEGAEFLKTHVPQLATVVCAAQFRDSVESVVVEGHTDRSEFSGSSKEQSENLNLKLSQDRSMQVVSAALDDLSGSPAERSCFLNKLSASGRGEQDALARKR